MQIFDVNRWQRIQFEQTPIYIHPKGPNWFVPNSSGDALLRRLVEDPQSPLKPDDYRFLHRLPQAREDAYGGRGKTAAGQDLKELWLHITDRCNQACSHCLFSCTSSSRAEMETAHAIELAEQAFDLGCRVFVLTGGEPLVHRGFVQIVDRLLAMADTHVAVLTNGTVLTDLASNIVNWPKNRFHLQVSVDGSPDQHDTIRGTGSFEKMEIGLRSLAQIGAPFTVAMCPSTHNLDQINHVVEFAARSGASNMHFMWHFAKGRSEQQPIPDIEKLFDRVRAGITKAARLGLGIDNVDALRSQVFAPTGTVHDGTTSGVESAAVGPDGMLYPSPAMVGTEEVATPIERSNSGLFKAWKTSPVLRQTRDCSFTENSSAWRLITGGGDSDHIHFSTNSNGDPYIQLYEKLAGWLISQEAGKYPDDGPSRLRLKMGDLLESCGAHGDVAFVHGNCLVSVASHDARTAVKDFYNAAAVEENDDILNPACYSDELVEHIPPEHRVRGYGCGSPILSANLSPGEQVVDLGCGAGVECFIASLQVGPTGGVTGIDMLEPMLARARQAARAVHTTLGYDNLGFKRGYLEQLPLENESVDAVLSNCVLNLSPDKRRTFAEIIRVLKPGGRLVVSDVVCDTEPSAAIRNDDRLKGECIGGALTGRDLFGILDETGFVAARVLSRFPYRVVGGHQFYSLTFEAMAPAPTVRQRVIYRGPFSGVITRDGSFIPAGQAVEVTVDAEHHASDDLFIVENDGSITAPGIEAPSCCAAPLDSPGCCSHDAATEQTASCCGESAECTNDQHHHSNCMVCGSELAYGVESEEMTCEYCGLKSRSNARCTNGHFVCDQCHSATGIEAIGRICRSTTETDMISLLQTIRTHSRIPLHGPEHHALVPAVMMTVYRNSGGLVTDELLDEGIERGRQIPGGHCGFFGTCGAATGVGAGLSLLLEATPLTPKKRKIVQQATATALAEIGEYEAARCCQRDSWIALKTAARLSKDILPVKLKAEATLECTQVKQNRECIGVKCPLFPRKGQCH